LINRFIDHLSTRLGITSNYNAIADLHILQITTVPAKLFQSAVFTSVVPWYRLLTVEILQFHALRFYLHNLPCRTQMNWLGQSQSQIQSYVTTDGQSPCLSWNNAPIWRLRPDFCYCQIVAGLLMWGNLSDERTVLLFIIVADPRQRSQSRVRVPRDWWPYFTVSASRLPQHWGPGPRIYVPRNGVAQWDPQALGSLFVVSYDSQGYGVLTRPDWLGRPNCLKDNSSPRTT
jgi:hypothetical protein